MNRNLHSTTKMTEFAREFDEEPETYFTKFVNKLTSAYNNGYNTVNIAPSQSVICISDVLQDGGSTSSAATDAQLNITDKSSSTSDNISNDDSATDKLDDLPLDDGNERTPSNVLHRLTDLMATTNNSSASNKGTEHKRFWMPDSKVKECYECSQKFSTFRRKHHCRLCGQIFCSKCCNQLVPGKIINCSGDQKVCTYCSKIVLSYLKSSAVTSDLKSDLQALQDDLSSKLSAYDHPNMLPDPTASALHRKISVGYQEERLVSTVKSNLSSADRKNILQQSNSLKSLHDDMSKVLPHQNRGVDLVQYLIVNQKSANHVQAVAILNAMIEAGFLIAFLMPVPTTSATFSAVASSSDDDPSLREEFNETVTYKLLRHDDVMTHSGSYQLDLDLESSSVHLSRPPPDVDLSFVDEAALPPNAKDSFGFSTTKDLETQNALLSTAGSKSLMQAFCAHEELLLTQLLRNECLSESWAKILLQLCARIANSIRPDLCGMMELVDNRNLMDIRNFVNFKKVPGGQQDDSQIVGGVVFTKNVVHKEMASFIENPRVLLLQCAIVYQRVEGKFVSIETLLLQERESLRNVTARILSLKPNVVLVHKSVSGIAQDMLRSHGITLVLDVKLSVLDRLSRCLKCDIVDSIESNVGVPKLGTCDRFYIKSFDDQNGVCKTLAFFQIQSNSRGCCALLRGGNNAELVKVKKVAAMLLFARYNWRLEMSFLLDEFARPPSPKPSIFDSKDHSPSKNDIVGDVQNDACSTGDDNDADGNRAVGKCEKSLKYEAKKCEEILVTKENVQDFSDPLRATDLSPSAFDAETSVEFAVEMPYDNRFRTALSSIVLSISPHVAFPLPFLETEQGRKCALRSFYPNELYYSKQWSDTPEKPIAPETIPAQQSNTALRPPHEFVTHKITSSIDSRDMQTLLASYRACGGRLPKASTMSKIFKRPKTNNAALSAGQAKPCDADSINKDALDLNNHQRLPVLFCSYYFNPNASSSFCVQPSLLNMTFYGTYDIMLGKFLHYYCFRKSYMCSSCNLPMLEHIRRYVHSMGCVQVKLTEDHTTQSSEHILMTSWCSICHEMTPSVNMSKDTLCMSFAKYLEHRFHSHAYKRRTVDLVDNKENTNDMQSGEAAKSNQQCPHSMHRDHVQYFSYNGIVASFMYTAIEVWEIGLPPLILTLHDPLVHDCLAVLEEIKSFAQAGYEVYAKIYDKLAHYASDVDFPLLASLKQNVNRDQLAFREKIGIVQTLLTDQPVSAHHINDAMLIVKKTLADNIDFWNQKLIEAAIQARSALANKAETSNALPVDSGTICTEDLRPDSPSAGADTDMPAGDSVPGVAVAEDGTFTPIVVVGGRKDSANLDGASTRDRQSSSGDSSPVKPQCEVLSFKEPSDKKSVKTLLRELLPSDKHVSSVLQSPLPSNEHHGLTIGLFPVLVHDQDLSSAIAYSLMSNEYKKALENLHSGYAASNDAAAAAAATVAPSPSAKRKSHDGSIDADESKESTASKDTADKKSQSTRQHIEVQFHDVSTQFTCRTYFARDFDAMRYNFIRPERISTTAPKDTGTDVDSRQKEADARKHAVQRIQSQPDMDGTGSRAAKETDHGRTNSLTPHPVAGVRFDHKDNVHRQEIDDVRCAFARSLAKSAQWKARGGKSGSKFCKTLDDRFVLKEMSKTDLTIFENFAPNYFEYINQCLAKGQATLLAKIYGVFKVTIKKKDSVLEKTLLVMENLFFGCRISHKFDLKGSDRNRLVDTTNLNGEIVLLDENLIQMSWSKPLYILSHSKTILHEAIDRDASFLEKNVVMDYSLLVGLNSDDKLLVLGIIDYIRTFTLDKRIESIVKQSGFLGGQGKLPTVISPNLYRQRFSEAMDRYFLSVPDRWVGLAKK